MSYGEEHYMDENQRRIKTIFVCEHCGEEVGKAIKLCEFCKTKALREEMDNENKKIFETAGLIYHCKFCGI